MNYVRSLKSRKCANSGNPLLINVLRNWPPGGCTTPVREARALHRSGLGESDRTPWKLRLVFHPCLRYHVVMNTESIENIASKLAEAVPEGLKSMREDLEQNFRSVLKASLNKLDLVTREEFEVQEAVLARTRAKLEALEAKLNDMT